MSNKYFKEKAKDAAKIRLNMDRLFISINDFRNKYESAEPMMSFLEGSLENILCSDYVHDFFMSVHEDAVNEENRDLGITNSGVAGPNLRLVK